MKVVFDVGQWVSGVINPRGHAAQLMRAWQNGQIEMLTSPGILEDLRRVLHYPHIRKRLPWNDKEIETFLNAIRLKATVTPGQLALNAVPDDPSDSKIVECAVEGKARYIVSSDLHLTKLGTYRSIPIVPPRHLLAELGL